MSNDTRATLIALLAEVIGVSDLEPGEHLATLGIESVDLLEWFVTIEEDYAIGLDAMLDGDVDVPDDPTLDDLCRVLVPLVEAASPRVAQA